MFKESIHSLVLVWRAGITEQLMDHAVLSRSVSVPPGSSNSN